MCVCRTCIRIHILGLGRDGLRSVSSQITKFMGAKWGPPGSCRLQMGPMVVPGTLLLGIFLIEIFVPLRTHLYWFDSQAAKCELQYFFHITPRLIIKTILPRYGDSHVRDKTCLATAGIFILVRRYLHIETAPCVPSSGRSCFVKPRNSLFKI